MAGMWGAYLDQRSLGDPRLALEVLAARKGGAGFVYGPPCGEPLFQAVPRPRSTPLAAYLAKHYRGVVDLVIVDEAHQFTNQDRAAGQELAQFMGAKMLLLTGSVSNGYGVGLFAILWCISKKFRERFARDEVHDFGRMFGYLRRYVDCVDKDTREVVAYSKSSDRVEPRRTIGYAPGILPSLLLMHLLPVAAVLQMKDLEVDLPARSEVVELLEADKVPAKKREAWLKREVMAKGKRVLICNPAAVETGLNCLTHICTLVWFQPPDCDPRAKRKAEGRVYRIGQNCPVRIHWLLYKGTSQEVLHRLLLLNVAESEAVDGLDRTSALRASGVGAPVGMPGFDLGRAIFEAVEAEDGARPRAPGWTPAGPGARSPAARARRERSASGPRPGALGAHRAGGQADEHSGARPRLPGDPVRRHRAARGEERARGAVRVAW